MTSQEHPLDNVIWSALTTRQAEFAQGTARARRFLPEIGPLAGIPDFTDKSYQSLANLAGERTVGLFLPEPFTERAGWKLVAAAPLVQMVWEGDKREAAGEKIEIVVLGGADSAAMQELTALTRPGPFGPRTHELGNFFGIRDQGKLVAMAGERMRVPGYTEISAVCTHPDYLGRGYASMLIQRVMQGIFARGETPFLHSRSDNDRAVAVYERLGFRPRQHRHLAVLQRE